MNEPKPTPAPKSVSFAGPDAWLRIALYSQLIWVALIGMLFRGWIAIPDLFPPLGPSMVKRFELIIVIMLYGFPGLVLWVLTFARYPCWRVVGVLIIQIALTTTYFVALLPAIQ